MNFTRRRSFPASLPLLKTLDRIVVKGKKIPRIRPDDSTTNDPRQKQGSLGAVLKLGTKGCGGTYRKKSGRSMESGGTATDVGRSKWNEWIFVSDIQRRFTYNLITE